MSAILELEDVVAGYGKVQVLHGLSFTIPRGAVVALLGPNGAGKTTTLRTIAGTVKPSAGRILFRGKRIDGRSPYDIARRGLLLVPEGRGIFPGLSVEENLEIGARAGGRLEIDERVRDVIDMFPQLGDRRQQRAGTMSGGEQQMLALSRAFLAEPDLMLMDEISMGLAPQIVAQLFESIGELKRRGHTIVLVEQFLTYALQLADLVYVMNKGEIQFVGEPHELREGVPVAGYIGA